MNSNATDPHSLRFSRSPASLPLLSADYFIALLPPIIWSCYLTGPRTLLLILLAAIGISKICGLRKKKKNETVREQAVHTN